MNLILPSRRSAVAAGADRGWMADGRSLLRRLFDDVRAFADLRRSATTGHLLKASSGHLADACSTTPATGACCVPGQVCSVITQAACTTAGGTYKGNTTTCGPDPCTYPCCTATVCSNKTPAACAAGGGLSYPAVKNCSTVSCGECGCTGAAPNSVQVDFEITICCGVDSGGCVFESSVGCPPSSGVMISNVVIGGSGVFDGGPCNFRGFLGDESNIAYDCTCAPSACCAPNDPSCIPDPSPPQNPDAFVSMQGGDSASWAISGDNVWDGGIPFTGDCMQTVETAFQSTDGSAPFYSPPCNCPCPPSWTITSLTFSPL